VVQLERAKRYLGRIRKIYSGVFSTSGHSKESYDDDVISFFIHCYHIRDWLIHLEEFNVTKSEIDLYIDSQNALKICADLANGSKHCKLTRTLRTERQPHIGDKEYRTEIWFSGGSGGETMQARYTISSYMEKHDVLSLAEECVRLWDEFINTINSHNK